MNKIVNKFFLAGDKFMSEMHLRKENYSYRQYLEHWPCWYAIKKQS